MSGPLKFTVDKFDKETALFFAKLSKAAYYTPKAFIHFLRQEDIDPKLNYKFIDLDSSQAYVLWDDENFIVAFRGTETQERKDILSDAKFWKKPAWEGGKVHSGYKEYVDEIWADIKMLFFQHGTNLETKKTKKVYFTGHSLGGAAATIGAARLGTFVTGCFTYGSPRVGNRAFTKSIFCPVWRFRNKRDLVTRVPTLFMGFKHVGKFCYIDENGTLRIGAVSFARLFKDSFKSMFNFTIGDGVLDHSIGDYCKHINSCDKVLVKK